MVILLIMNLFGIMDKILIFPSFTT